jgi:hypothetical protein
MEEAIAQQVTAYDLEIGPILPHLLAARARIPPGRSLDVVAEAFRSNPAVKEVRRSGIVRLDQAATSSFLGTTVRPNDRLFPFQARQYSLVDLPRAWNIRTSSPSVIVAVIDDGISQHQDVVSNLTTDGYDFVIDVPVPLCSGGTVSRSGDGDDFDPDPTKPVGYLTDPVFGCLTELNPAGNHGLQVASVIGAVGNDNQGIAGATWSVQIRPIRVFGVALGATEPEVAIAILYAAGFELPLDEQTTLQVTPADVINMSLGFPDPVPLVEGAVELAEEAGVTVIATAGNDAKLGSSYPAAYPTVLSIGAINALGLDARASYSNFGLDVDVYAPGGELSLGFDFGTLMAVHNFVTGELTWEVAQGTSFSAPMVSGLAALILAQEPGLPPAEVRRRIIDYAVNSDVGKVVNFRNSLTQSMPPTGELFASVVDATSGETVRTVKAVAGGAYTADDLPPGEHYVYGGLDEEGDGQIGFPGRIWGAFGGSASPTAVTVGMGNSTASFQVGFPFEAEPNDLPAAASILSLGGYSLGDLPSGDVDYYQVQVPSQGTYTFETYPVTGACGFVFEYDTVLTLVDEAGTVIASNDDSGPGDFDLCSRITTSLGPGSYFVAVEALPGINPNAVVPPGIYSIAARSGS